MGLIVPFQIRYAVLAAAHIPVAAVFIKISGSIYEMPLIVQRHAASRLLHLPDSVCQGPGASQALADLQVGILVVMP